MLFCTSLEKSQIAIKNSSFYRSHQIEILICLCDKLRCYLIHQKLYSHEKNMRDYFLILFMNMLLVVVVIK